MHWKALMMGMKPNDFTFSTVLLICAKITAYDQGKQVHILTIKYGFDSYNFVGIYLVGMSANVRLFLVLFIPFGNHIKIPMN